MKPYSIINREKVIKSFISMATLLCLFLCLNASAAAESGSSPLIEEGGFWINYLWDYKIPQLDGKWDIKETVTNPSTCSAGVIRQTIRLAEASNVLFEISVWENILGLTQDDWLDRYGRPLFGGECGSLLEITPYRISGISLVKEYDGQSFAEESVFVLIDSWVFRLRYIHTDDGLNQESFSYLIEHFQACFRTLDESQYSERTAVPAPPKLVPNPKGDVNCAFH